MESDFARLVADGVSHQRSVRNDLRSLFLSTLGHWPYRMRHQTKFLRCVFCHYVFDDQLGAFERQILLLKSLGSFVDTAACLSMIEGKREIDGKYFHMSFDDGFKNILTNAIPIMRKHRVPALLFVPTAFVGAPYERVKEYCVTLAHYKKPIEMATWEDLKCVIEQGVDIGSHTRTHARFSEISKDPGRLTEELEGSKNDIERHLGVPCVTISWPYGQLKDADAESVAATRKAGYRACFGAFRGTIRNGGCDPYMTPRHHFEAQWPESHLKYFVS